MVPAVTPAQPVVPAVTPVQPVVPAATPVQQVVSHGGTPDTPAPPCTPVRAYRRALSLLLSQRLLPAHLHVKMPCLMMRVTTACRQMWKHMCQSLPKRSQIHAPSAWRRSKWESR